MYERSCYYLFLFASCILTEVNAVVTKLSCSGPCVAQTVQYHCETDSAYLFWQQGDDTLGGSANGITLKDADGYNVTTLPTAGGGLSSNISFLADGNNETTIHCIDLLAGLDITKNCSLIIAPVPVINSLMFTAINSTSVLLHWTSPPVTPDCTAMYIVEVNVTNPNTIFQTKNTNEPAVNVSSLMMNTNYSYRVAGIDNAGRMGDWSINHCFQLKVPGPVNILSVNASDVQDESLTLEWNVHESDDSECSPQVNGYKYTVYASNSMTSSEGTKTHNQTTLIISDVQQGETYLVTIIAVSNVGEGEPAKINISIPSDTSLSSAGTHNYLSTSTSGMIQSSSIRLTESTVTTSGVRIFSPTNVLTTPVGSVATTTGCHCSVPVLISVCVSGVLSSVVSILVTSIMCLVKKKWQGIQDPVKNTPISPTPIYDTVTVTADKENIELTGNVAYAHVNM